MMKDIERARGLLAEKNYTCVLCRGAQVIHSEKRGIAPVLDLINEGADLSGFSVADKIVGKAAAMLFAYAGVREVYAEILSESGADTLKNAGITFSYGKLTPRIINRAGTGICPMEQAVGLIENPNAALEAIRARVRDLCTLA